MKRRYWPALLAVAALAVFATYLAYTQYVVAEIKAQARVNSRIYSLVQRGLLAQPGEELAALVDIQVTLDSIDVPIVVFGAAGEPYGATNLPESVLGMENPPPDLIQTPGARRRLAEFAATLESRNPANKAVAPGIGTVYFGDPPLLAWLRWVPYLQVAGALLLVLVAFAIIRADVRAERERLWAAMARELAHQMGTPLSSLAGWIEVLRLPAEERAALVTADHVADVIDADVERLERVSRRFELIGKRQTLEPVQVRDVVDELEQYFRPRLPKLGRGIALRTRVERALPAVRANRVLLVWALENVIKNAIDALGGRGGRILVAAHGAANGRLHIHIADDGPGIPPEVRDRIFDPGVTTKSGGWGVGLSLTRRIIHELHGGRVSVRERPRGGTVFDIVLPVTGPGKRREGRSWSRWST
jgi:signal transduction histidine kinase